MWPEIEVAFNEKRHEIVLSGPETSKRISISGLDTSIFQLNSLNYLNINETCLNDIPDDILKLNNLQTLVLHSNKLSAINPKIAQLEKLKILDLSRNNIEELPKEFEVAVNLVTLILSGNRVESFPTLNKCIKLSMLDLANNKLTKFPDICHPELSNLQDLKLNGNLIEEIPTDINALTALKTFDISSNQLKTVPGEIVDCTKLKDLNLKDNPVSDRRLRKLIDQCRTKQVLDYVKQHCPKTTTANNSANKKGKKNSKSHKEDQELSDDETDYTHEIKVQHSSEDFKVIIFESVKTVREHFMACIVHNVSFTEESFRKFIQLQNKLHETVCERRNAATLATHDLKKLLPGNLTYTTKPPKELIIKPLNSINEMTGEELYNKLQKEAIALRKEKKRNVYSGIHKYLYLIEGKSHYPCVLNEKGDVVSFPPITNSDISKIERNTTSILIEVTSSKHQDNCKGVIEALLKEMISLFNTDLDVQQVRVTNLDGELKSVYPGRKDLAMTNTNIKVTFC